VSDRDWRNFLIWFSSGFTLAAILSFAYDVPNDIPAIFVFGLFCFGCGFILMFSFYLRTRSREFDELIKSTMKTTVESLEQWKKDFDELKDDRAKFEAEKDAWQESRNSEG
jgi:hypothetical protein